MKAKFQKENSVKKLLSTETVFRKSPQKILLSYH